VSDHTTHIWHARFESGAVAADHALASKAGAQMLEAGGNAVDAAAAASFALSVVRPYSCGIGGGGFMLVHLREHPRHVGTTTIALDYRETAPASVHERTFLETNDPDAPARGGLSVGVPGTVFGLVHAVERFGTLPVEVVIAPAIRLALAGIEVDGHYERFAQEAIDAVRNAPGGTARYAFVWERLLLKGMVRAGDRVELREQAAALDMIARSGAGAMRSGPLAQAVVRAVERERAFAGERAAHLTLKDLDRYAVKSRDAMRHDFLGAQCLGFPLPSSGGLCLEMVGSMLASRPELLRGVRDPDDPLYVHAMSECFQHAFAFRAAGMGDADVVQAARALHDARLRLRRAESAAQMIDPARTLAVDAYGEARNQPGAGGTSHLCAVDRWGNAAACTETINNIFGSLVAVEEYAFVLNDTLDDFACKPGMGNAFGLREGNANTPAAGKRPLSCMTPTIVLDAEGGVRAVLGGSGGPRIITSVAQVLANHVRFGQSPDESVRRARFHHQWQPKVLGLEHELLESPLAGYLRERGHEVVPRDIIGSVQLIALDARKRWWHAVCDPRKPSSPAGL
jgi:gamma-glutamyltranspeptidase/glutathione hydrolase